MHSISALWAALLAVAGFASAANRTADSGKLKTWWHETGEINTKTAVELGNVRQSHVYDVQVRTVEESVADLIEDLLGGSSYYDSFVYETIPRNGNGNIQIPGNSSSTTDDYDGITVENTVNITMAWSQFLYSTDVVVRVQRPDHSSSTGGLTIRPTTLDYTVTEDNGDVLIKVPYSEHGARFSVEFDDDLYEYRNNCDGTDCDFCQDVDSDADYYCSEYTDSNIVMGVEPRNALLIFASPFPESSLVPDLSSSSVLNVTEGLVSGLNNTSATTVVFNPGVYWMTGTSHAILNSSVNWVYFAPGAYVKGAIEFDTGDDMMMATGHGVLSGEQYVYQANTEDGYTNLKSDGNSLRMWSGDSWGTKQQTFLLAGPTVNAPPFNSMDFDGDQDTLTVQSWDYKQVGAFFAQTDGMEIYPGSSVHDVFYHSGDDTIKTYYSNVDVQRVTVWKTKTAPVIQFGWASRNMTNVTVNDVSVIHSRYAANSSHPSLIGANQIYTYSEDDTSTGVLTNTIQDVVFSNIRSEGIGGNLFRICPLATFKNVTIANVSLDKFSQETNGILVSELAAWTNSDGEQVGTDGFTVSNFTVGGEKVSYEKDNWATNSTGKMNVAEQYMQKGQFTVM